MQQPVVPPSGGAPGYCPPPVPAAPAAKPTGASYLLGFLGALLGALVGAIPWFIVSTFFHFFVGWLGFVVGLASFFGYKLFKGAKNLPFAMVCIIVLSILSICLAEFVGYAVFVHQELEEILASYGITSAIPLSVTLESTIEVLTSPDVIGEAVGNLVIGLVIAVLGIVAVRRQIFVYTQAGAPAYPEAGGVPAANPYAPAAPYAGQPVPPQAMPADPAVPAQANPQAAPVNAAPPAQAAWQSPAAPATAPVPAPPAASVIPTATAGVSQPEAPSGGIPPVPPAPSVAPFGQAETAAPQETDAHPDPTANP